MARRIIPYSHHGFRPYVEALGQLALAWNELHFNLSLLYCSLMGARVGIPVDQHFAVWHALKMDRAQRDILRAAATSSGLQRAPNAPASFLDDIEWLCGRADVIEDARNNAMHTPLWGIADENDVIVSVMPAAVAQGHVRAQRLARSPNLLSEFRWCRDASICLTTYSFSVHMSIFRNFASPWPRRPAWPTRQATSMRKPRPRVPKAAHPLPPRSSPA
jgi:hypothetical protein